MSTINLMRYVVLILFLFSSFILFAIKHTPIELVQNSEITDCGDSVITIDKNHYLTSKSSILEAKCESYYSIFRYFYSKDEEYALNNQAHFVTYKNLYKLTARELFIPHQCAKNYYFSFQLLETPHFGIFNIDLSECDTADFTGVYIKEPDGQYYLVGIAHRFGLNNRSSIHFFVPDFIEWLGLAVDENEDCTTMFDPISDKCYRFDKGKTLKELGLNIHGMVSKKHEMMDLWSFIGLGDYHFVGQDTIIVKHDYPPYNSQVYKRSFCLPNSVHRMKFYLVPHNASEKTEARVLQFNRPLKKLTAISQKQLLMKPASSGLIFVNQKDEYRITGHYHVDKTGRLTIQFLTHEINERIQKIISQKRKQEFSKPPSAKKQVKLRQKKLQIHHEKAKWGIYYFSDNTNTHGNYELNQRYAGLLKWKLKLDTYIKENKLDPKSNVSIAFCTSKKSQKHYMKEFRMGYIKRSPGFNVIHSKKAFSISESCKYPLKEFLNYARMRCPAKYTIVILDIHPLNSLGLSFHSKLGIKDVAEAFKGHHFDMIASESCDMARIDILPLFSPYCDHLLFSQNLVSYHKIYKRCISNTLWEKSTLFFPFSYLSAFCLNEIEKNPIEIAKHICYFHKSSYKFLSDVDKKFIEDWQSRNHFFLFDTLLISKFLCKCQQFPESSLPNMNFVKSYFAEDKSFNEIYNDLVMKEFKN